MPYGSSTRSTVFRKKSSYKKKRPNKRVFIQSKRINKNSRYIGAPRSTVQKGYLPFGGKFWARLPYTEIFSITGNSTTNAAVTTYTFRTNDNFDPRVEIGGHQPMQFDILSTIYHRFTVWSCKVLIEFSNPTADGLHVGYRIRNIGDTNATSGMYLDYLNEMRNAETRPINNTGSQRVTFNLWIDNPRLMGLSRGQYGDINYSHLTSSSPANSSYIEPFAIAHGASDSTVQCKIKLIYYTQCTQDIAGPQS